MTYAFYPGCSYNSAAGYKESVDAVSRMLAIELDEIRDWNCCGASVYPGIDKVGTLRLGARVLALANKTGHTEIVTGCNACYTTLRKVTRTLSDNEAYLTDVNRSLADEGLTYNPLSRIRHLLDVFVNDVPDDRWEAKRQNDYSGTGVAAYYGCQLTRPWNDLEPRDMLEKLIAKAGFTPVEHSAKTMCCGASVSVPYAKESRPLIQRIINGVRQQKADLVATVCPLCQLNLDQGQTDMGSSVPVTYFSQIAGLGLGISPAALGLDKLLIGIKKECLHGNET